ncbi:MULTISPECIES: AAA family ATPase [unclassified Micromonospora]|uniref:McrB family protein n=1 Tax=unclassified Micromonospora TaxID=2617518 RepID=UPI001C21642A|nr:MULTISPECIES: AAA family ATPase [unclassified Micromonospora]MBU8857414.1 AAA family ATPase [Micromonospora sp. WMMB482]MDM4783037.1 AAA family ATPase [Micromonospora sp. b486]
MPILAGEVRILDADELDIGAEKAIAEHASSRPDDPPMRDDDPIVWEVRELLEHYGGVIFTGPPGTSKTWYAAKVGTALVHGDPSRIRFIQFHPSYQYEDFMQGFVPREDGSGFELKAKQFLEMCREAGRHPTKTYVLVIDELSRGDPGRVFGEALTYIEKSKRGIPFTLASGEECIVPHNFVLLATMNPLDRGVDEVDAAFERRFPKLAMDPNREILRSMLEASEMADDLIRRVVGFFDYVNGLAKSTPQAAIGHTYFTDARDATSLERVWRYQLRFVLEKAYRLDPNTYAGIEAAWRRVLPGPAEGLSKDPEEQLASAAAAGDQNPVIPTQE